MGWRDWAGVGKGAAPALEGEGGEFGLLVTRGTRLKMLATLPKETGNNNRATISNQRAQRQLGVSCFPNNHCTSSTASTNTPACSEVRPRPSKKLFRVMDSIFSSLVCVTSSRLVPAA